MAKEIQFNARFQQKFDTHENWLATDIVLKYAERVLVKMNTGEIREKVGDGVSKYSELEFTDKFIKDNLANIGKLNIENAEPIDNDSFNNLMQKPEEHKENVTWTSSNPEVIACIDENPDTTKIRYTGSEGTYNIEHGVFASGKGGNSAVFGGKSQVIGTKSFATGSKNIALGGQSFATGSETFAAGQDAFTSGNNTSAIGNYSHAEGQRTVAEGNHSHAEGCKTKALGDASHSEGYETEALKYAHAEGYLTKASGTNSHAEGNSSIAHNNNSHAEGLGTNAVGKHSHSEGAKTYANGDASHAEGVESVADGLYSHAEGNSTKAGGTSSHAEGTHTQALATNAHAEGNRTEARKAQSHAEGNYTIADSVVQHVEGSFNEIDSEGKYLHIVGNGRNEDNRSNAHTLDWKGNTWFAGDIKIGGTSYDDVNAKTLLTEENADEKFTEFKENVDKKIVEFEETIDNAFEMLSTVVPLREELYPNGELAVMLNTCAKHTNGHGTIDEQTIYGNCMFGVGGQISQISTNVKVDILGPIKFRANAIGDDIMRINIDGETYEVTDSPFEFEGTVKEYFRVTGPYGTDLYFEYFVIDNKKLFFNETDASESNINNGTGEKSLQQSLDTDSWNTSNEVVKEYVTNLDDEGNLSPITTADGKLIEASINGDTVTINVGAYGKLSTMMNGKSQTVGGKSHAEGSKTIAFENNSHAEGNETFAAGKHSHAEGNTTTAIGNSAHAEGMVAVAEGNASHAEGYSSKAIGEASHAEGLLTEANKNYSHAEGNDTKANGEMSHAEGYKTEASGYASHAEGGRTKAKGAYNHAGGFETIANGDYQTVIGRANKEDTSKAFIIGNGDINDDYTVDDDKRTNAAEVDWDGNAWFAGDVKVGESAKILATVEEVENSIAKIDVKFDELNEKITNNALLDAHSIELKKTISLAGDDLEDSKDNAHIHTMSVTNNNEVVFDQEYEITNRFFGYVGVKNVISGSYMLVAEIDVETDFDMSKARVQGYYQQIVGGSTLPEGVIVGIPKNGKNYILYPFIASEDKPVRGFYFDAQGTNKPTVKLTLHDVRLYETFNVENNIDLTNLKDWKCEFYQKGDLVKSSIDDYALIYDGANLIVSSLSNAMDAEVILYKSLEEDFVVKEEFNALSNAVTAVEDAVATKAEQEDLDNKISSHTHSTVLPSGYGVYVDVDKTDSDYYIVETNSDNTGTIATLFSIASEENPLKVRVSAMNPHSVVNYTVNGVTKNANINTEIYIEEEITQPIIFNIAYASGSIFSSIQYEHILTDGKAGFMSGNQAKTLADLSTIVNAKGLTFMQYASGSKIPLEKGCFYYLRCNADTIYYYKNGEKLSQYTEGFGDGLVMMATNIYQGARVNFFAAPSAGTGFLGSNASMNGYTITTLDTDDIYAMSTSDAVNVWRLKV